MLDRAIVEVASDSLPISRRTIAYLHSARARTSRRIRQSAIKIDFSFLDLYQETLLQILLPIQDLPQSQLVTRTRNPLISFFWRRSLSLYIVSGRRGIGAHCKTAMLSRIF